MLSKSGSVFEKKTNIGFIYHVKKNTPLLIMLSPGIAFFLLFSYLPIFGIVVAFENFNFRDRFLSPFIGLENFKFLFLTGDIWGVARNTILYNISFIVINSFISILCAIMLAELSSKWFKKITQTIMLLPYFVSWVIVGSIVYNLLNYYNGFANSIIVALGFKRIDFYSNPNIWPFLIVLFNAWKTVGYSTVFYLAAIMNINPEIYEAAEIDGANIYVRIRKITIPFLMPTVAVLVLLSIGNIFRGDFNMFYNLVGRNSMLYPVTDVVDTFVTRSLLQSNSTGMAASAGLLQSVICFITILTVNKAVKLYNEDYALF